MVNYKESQSQHSQLGIVSTEGQIERVSILRDEENTKEICSAACLGTAFDWSAAANMVATSLDSKRYNC